MTSQEDDATELQFPKGIPLEPNFDSVMMKNEEKKCCCCSLVLQYPYILCSDCKLLGRSIEMCVSCFAKGREFYFHKNDHDYIIKQDDPVLSSDWKGTEEIQLLNETLRWGYGNWSSIAKHLGKSAEECGQHYLNSYIDNPNSDLFTLIPPNTEFFKTPNPYYTSNSSDDPPRPSPSSVSFREMAGYNAARGDFITEYMNDAEMLIQDMDSDFCDSGDALSEELQVTLLDIYRRQLGERESKRRIISQHGLINLGKVSMLHNHYKSALPEFAPLIPALHSLLSYDEMISILEGLIYEEELKTYIRELKECRINGITKQEQVSIYDTLKKKRDIMKRKKYKLILPPELSDSNSVESKIPITLKRNSLPLDITGEVEYETLNEDEKDLASSLRILPAKFNKIKYGMIEECRKLNGLQLRHARSLFKIDVNKIRKIYDYLIGEGLVFRPIPTK